MIDGPAQGFPRALPAGNSVKTGGVLKNHGPEIAGEAKKESCPTSDPSGGVEKGKDMCREIKVQRC